MLIELHAVARFSSGRAALFDDPEFEGNEIMLLRVFVHRAAQMGGLAVAPVQGRRIDGVLHRAPLLASLLLDTFPGAIELPAMVWTTNPFFIDAAERQ